MKQVRISSIVTEVGKRLVGEVKQLRSEQLLILVANKVKQIAASRGVGWGVPSTDRCTPNAGLRFVHRNERRGYPSNTTLISWYITPFVSNGITPNERFTQYPLFHVSLLCIKDMRDVSRFLHPLALFQAWGDPSFFWISL